MDKQTATQLIGNTFNFPFDEGRFRNFAINLLNNVDEAKRFDYISGTYIRHSFKNHITKYKRLGTYTDPNGDKIDVLVVQLKNEWALERSRTMLRNFTSDYLKNRDEKDAALVAYYTTNPDDWRFSYIRMEYKRVQTDSGKFKIKEDITPAKRYSFLVGKNEPNHTAQAQLVGILSDDRKNPTLSELENAFSVDAVTKQFYKDYRAQFEKLWNELNDIVKKDPKIAEEFETKTIDTGNFAKKLMGQIVFLYFLQKKGWLGVGKDENGNFKEWGKGPKNFLHRLFKKEFTEYGNFFNDVLEPLFYEALATERTNDVFTRFNCKIPFLNGGLFEPINDYNWEETDIRIDNDLIGDVLKTFDQYNFTVREDEPLEKEVAVDPEMLGKVFENLLPENLRKGKGAYYTPRTIVHYMCQESLINYLDTECEPAPKEDIETLIREGDIILELETAIVEEGKKYKSVLMDSIKDNAQSLDDALANIKVCDPAIGSGAFPVGMLTEIVKARNVLSLYLESIDYVDGALTQSMHSKERTTYNLKRHCIQNSLYGVDIDPGAIEIAKLRLWLSLVVDEDDYTTIQPLPNLDYKIMQGNSLIEEFHGISLDIEKKNEQQGLFSGGSDLDTLIDDLHQKQDDFFNAEHPREKKEKREAVETAIYNIFHNELEKKKSISPQEAKDIETDLKEMTHGNKERNFFPWKLYFADVFREKGGFDVVIANPPYIKIQQLKKDQPKFVEYLKRRYESTKFGNIDIYLAFTELVFSTLNENGVSAYIQPNKFFTSKMGSGLRKIISQNNSLIKVVDFGHYQIFNEATTYTCLLFLTNKCVQNFLAYRYSNTSVKGKNLNLINFDSIESEFLKNDKWNFHKKEIRQLIVKLLKFENRLKTITRKIYVGLQTSADSIYVLNKINGKDTDKTLCELYSKSLDKVIKIEREIVKPFLMGKDVKRYQPVINNKYVIFPYEISNKKAELLTQSRIQQRYPLCWQYILENKTALENREKGKMKGPNFYAYIYPKNLTEFEELKILTPDIVNNCSFTLDYNGDKYATTTVYGFAFNDKKRFDLEYYLGIMNSKLMKFFVFTTGTILRGGYTRFHKQYVENFPVVENINYCEIIINKAKQILTAKKANPQADTSALEREIDLLVYELYGLTEDEIAIVEESVNV